MDVDLRAVSHNLSVARSLCPGAKILAILKGDAYGVGATVVAAALHRSRVEAFGVDNVAEGIALRTSGIRQMILVLDGCVPENAQLAVRYDLTPGISNVQLLHAYNDVAVKIGRPLPIWLHYNCGFNRSGHRSHREFRDFVIDSKAYPFLRVAAIYSHLPATHTDPQCSEAQAREYETALAIARDELGAALESSLLASHGILSQSSNFSSDWVRPGIMLYGSECFEANARTSAVADRISLLRPALNLRARMLHHLRFRNAEFCGLGQKYSTATGQTLGTVAIGFGHGLPTLAPTRLAVFTRGTDRYPLVTVGMDYSQVDLTQSSVPDIYDWVTVFGDPRLGNQSLRDFASSLNMSPWVLMRQLHVAKRYYEEGDDHA